MIRRIQNGRHQRRGQFLISQNSLHDRQRHLPAPGGVVNFFAFSRMRHVTAFDQDCRHRGVAQHGEPRTPHAAIRHVQVLHERFFHLICEQQAFVFVSVGRCRAVVAALCPARSMTPRRRALMQYVSGPSTSLLPVCVALKCKLMNKSAPFLFARAGRAGKSTYTSLLRVKITLKPSFFNWSMRSSV